MILTSNYKARLVVLTLFAVSACGANSSSSCVGSNPDCTIFNSAYENSGGTDNDKLFIDSAQATGERDAGSAGTVTADEADITEPDQVNGNEVREAARETEKEAHKTAKAERNAAKEGAKAERPIAKAERKIDKGAAREERLAAKAERRAAKEAERAERKTAEAERKAAKAERKAAKEAAKVERKIEKVERKAAKEAAKAGPAPFAGTIR